MFCQKEKTSKDNGLNRVCRDKFYISHKMYELLEEELHGESINTFQ